MRKAFLWAGLVATIAFLVWLETRTCKREVARATFAAAVKRWPRAKITLRNGARIIEKTWPADN
jgi:hypothetical protein